MPKHLHQELYKNKKRKKNVDFGDGLRDELFSHLANFPLKYFKN
jgi:hypothetical protein